MGREALQGVQARNPRGQSRHPGLGDHSLSAARQSACALLPQLSSIDLNDQVEGDDRAFEIWHEREDSVRKYLLQARTVITKNSWVKEICGIQQRLALPIWRECLGSWGKAGRETEPLPGCLA